MTPEQFAYWLQGFIELNEGKAPTAAQWKSIKEHLGEVFTKVTPPIGKPTQPTGTKRIEFTKEQIDELLKDMEKSKRHQHPAIYPGRIC